MVFRRAGPGRQHHVSGIRAVRPGVSRPFHPHLTLGRTQLRQAGLEELRERIERHAQFDASGSMVKQAVIFSSELSRSGPVYSVLGRAALGGR